MLDMLINAEGDARTFALADVFGPGATGFAVATSNGGTVAAAILDGVLTLTPGALGHADITLTATGAEGEALSHDFRAIVAGPNAYVFAIIPDTQDYTSNAAIRETFGNMTDWLLAQQESLGIAHVIHVGDIVQFGAESQWLIAEDAMERLDGRLSYTLNVGNHDQQRPGFSSAFSFESDVDAYFTPEQVGATPEQGGGTYDGFDVGEDTFGNGDTYTDSIRNHYTTITTPDGQDWLIFSLEFGMPDDVLRWASEIIEDHLDHRVIIDTHSWNGGDGRVTPTTSPLTTDNGGWGYAIRDNPRNVNDGEDAWRELASKYPNVTFTFNGHNFMGGAETVASLAAGGAPVHQMFVNYQNGALPNDASFNGTGGDGAIRLVVIDPDNSRFTTHTKLVERDGFYNAFPDHEEVFEGVDFGAPEQITIAKAGGALVAVAEGETATVALDPAASLENGPTTYAWFDAAGEKLGETDGAALEVELPAGVHRLTLKATDAEGNVSADLKTVLVRTGQNLLAETFDDGNADGWGVPVTPPAAVTIGTDLGFGAPSISGVAQIPVTLEFESSFRPYDDQTGEIMVSFDGGESFTTLLTLDTASVPGGESSLARANETIVIETLIPNSAASVQFAWRMSEADNDWWWAIDDVKVFGPGATTETVIWSENFDGLAASLLSAVDENIPATVLGWTHETPEGWTRTVDAPQGATEWQGWSFATPEFWTSADGQQRSSFTLGTGVIAIADGDEWDDFNGGSVVGDDFATVLTTDAIALDGLGEGASALRLTFDSSFRPYDAQTGEVLVSFDGGEFAALLTLDTSTVPGGQSSLARANETVVIDLAALEGAQDVRFRFDYRDADNDWWWAIDNLSLASVTTERPELFAEDFDGLPLQGVVDEPGDPAVPVWTPTPPEGWAQEVADTTSQGTTEWQGWTFADKDFWIDVAGNQSRDAFALGANTLAIADPDEWDDNNAGAAGDTNEFDSTLTTPAIDLTGVGGGQPGGEAAGVAKVGALGGAAGLLVTPAASGRFDAYTLIFDVLAQSGALTGPAALYQTDAANRDAAELYIGEAGGIGVPGFYVGQEQFAFDAWNRIVIRIDVQDGQQILSGFINGEKVAELPVSGVGETGSTWSIDADAGFLLFSDGAGLTGDLFVNAVAFTPDVLDDAAIEGLGGVDVDGPLSGPQNPDAFQLSFDGALDAVDVGSATVEQVSFAQASLGSFLVKGSIFGNPDGEGEAAVYAQSNGPNEILLYQDGFDWSNYVYDVVIEPADNDTVGVVFYWADASNYYEVAIDQQNRTRTLTRVQDGEATVLAQENGAYRHFARQDLRVAVGENGIIVTLDEALLFDGPVVDAEPLQGGTVGLLSRSMDRVEFDNVVVTAQTLAARLLGDARGVDLDGDGVATLSFTAAATISPAAVASFEWLVDGEVAATGETVEIEAPVGETVVTLRVTDVNGAVSTDARTVEVVPAEAVLLAADFSTDAAGFAFIDEGTIDAPGAWSVTDGALVQESDINSSQQGTGSRAYSVDGDGPYLLRDGTYALHDAEEAAAWRDYALEVTATSADNDGVGVLFRYQDADNYYKLEIDAQLGLVHLTRHLDGFETLLARAYGGYTPGEAFDIRIEAEGSRLGAWIDGAEVFGAQVDDTRLESGTVGLYTWANAGVAFDDLVVTRLGDAPGLNLIEGTDGNDRLAGTALADEIRTGGGRSDVVSGLGGGDRFVFENGAGRQVLRIEDYDAAEGDVLDLGGAQVAGVRDAAGRLVLTLDTDDVIILTGLSSVDEIVFAGDTLFG
ncbi:hypothetical protein [Rubrimonas cliftonensis]|uniref:Uncharacterized protein n=1 Tax=Rubrimonas cliftonensis TaxID=89524 RepID=A0A1H4CW75_9RHOB|nr:hypothetical protein [Rubrimonas cliftonensis]SEA64641.1 hypothetical protein SAMN05444370_10871 [Rubrimonas cliftonensis]